MKIIRSKNYCYFENDSTNSGGVSKQRPYSLSTSWQAYNCLNKSNATYENWKFIRGCDKLSLSVAQSIKLYNECLIDNQYQYEYNLWQNQQKIGNDLNSIAIFPALHSWK